VARVRHIFHIMNQTLSQTYKTSLLRFIIRKIINAWKGLCCLHLQDEVSKSLSPCHFTTDDSLVRRSSCRAPFGTHDQILICCQTITGLVVRGHLYDEKMGLSVTNCPIFASCLYREDKAVYSM
jgi:hypothetical protein